MNKGCWKKVIYYTVCTILFGISIAMLIPILSDAWRGGCLRFKELNGTISASEKEELKERERLSMKYDW